GVPRPVRWLEVLEDDARALVRIGRLAPHVEVALGRPGRRAPGALEPRMLVRGVVQHELGDDVKPAAVRLVEEILKIGNRAYVGVDVGVIRYIVPIVLQRTWIKWQKPNRGDAEVLQIVELPREAGEVAHAVAVPVDERADAKLVDDRVLVPVGVGGARGPGLL